jgi:hypothetical protein
MAQPDPTIVELRRLSRAVNKHSKVIDRLNGGVEALHELSLILPQLKALADMSTTIIAMAKAESQDQIFWEGLRKRLNPLRPIGAAFWTLALSGMGALAYELVKFRISGHF